MQNVVGGVVAQRIGHPDDDGAVFGQGAEPLHGEGAAFVVADLLEVADSKYALVIYSAKRARQINAYYSQLSEGLLEYVGPLVDSHITDKPLSIALREINEGLLSIEPTTEA